MRKSNYPLFILNVLVLLFSVSNSHANQEEVEEKARQAIIAQFAQGVDGSVGLFYRQELVCENMYSEIEPIQKKKAECKNSIEGDRSKASDLKKYLLTTMERAIKNCLPNYEVIDAIGPYGAISEELLKKYCNEENFKIAMNEILTVIPKGTKSTIKKNESLFKNNAKRMMSWYWDCPRDQPIYKCHDAIKNSVTINKTKPKSSFSRSTYPEFDLTTHPKKQYLTNNSLIYLEATSPHKACSNNTSELKKDYLNILRRGAGGDLHQAYRWLYGAFWHCLYHATKVQTKELARIELILRKDSGFNEIIFKAPEGIWVGKKTDYGKHLDQDFFKGELETKFLEIFIEKFPRISLKHTFYNRNEGWTAPLLSSALKHHDFVFFALDMAQHSLITELNAIKSINVENNSIFHMNYRNHPYGQWAKAPGFKVGENGPDITKGFRRPLNTFRVDNLVSRKSEPTVEDITIADKLGYEIYDIFREHMLRTNSLITFNFILGLGEKRINMQKELDSNPEELAHFNKMYTWRGEKDSLKLLIPGVKGHNRAELEAAGWIVIKARPWESSYAQYRSINFPYYLSRRPQREKEYLEYQAAVGKTSADSTHVATVEQQSVDTIFTEDTNIIEEKENTNSVVSLSSSEMAVRLKSLIKTQLVLFTELCMEVVPVGLNSKFSEENTRALFSQCAREIQTNPIACNSSSKDSKCVKSNRVESINREIASLQKKMTDK